MTEQEKLEFHSQLCKRMNTSPWQQKVLWDVIDEIEAKVSNPWHTGTPTEEGWYLITDSGILFPYFTARWDDMWKDCDISPKDIVAWQKITPYEGEEQFPCGCCKCYEDKKCILLDAEVGARTRDERCPLRKEKK